MEKLNQPLIPAGLTISQWNPADRADAEQARKFCLQMVKETYGYDYTPAWHADLDSLLQGEQSHYAPGNRGCFLLVKTSAGQIIGTAGMRSLTWKQNMVELFKDRYGTAGQVASNWRLYIHPQHRKQGLGKVLVELRNLAALRYGYTTMYLHCDINAKRLRNHWEELGFVNFMNEGQTAHYDKPLAAAAGYVSVAA